jgi:cell division protein FtsQ
MKKWQKIVLRLFSLSSIIVLMSIMYSTQNQTILKVPSVSIHVEGDDVFLTETELMERLKYKNLIYDGQMFEQLNIKELESHIRAMGEVKKVSVFTRIGNNWSIEVELRRPIARIFNKFGESFYLDSEGYTMSPSDLHTARVLIVNGDIPDKLNSPSVPELINNESLISIQKLDDIYRITNYVCNDPLLRAQIAQVHLNKRGEFVMIPQVGGHKIIFGTAYSELEVADKFEKLKIFYQEAIPYEGWNKYSEIILKYEKQIVCKKKN